VVVVVAVAKDGAESAGCKERRGAAGAAGGVWSEAEREA